MKKKNSFSFVKFIFPLAFVVGLLSSCSQKNKEGKFIPADASAVFLLNGKTFATKIPWAAIENNAGIIAAFADSSLPPELKKLMNAPAQSGIDIEAGVVIFSKQDQSGDYIAIEGNIKDEVAFTNFNKAFKEKGSFTENEGIKFVSLYPICGGWNSSKFIYIFDVSSHRYNHSPASDSLKEIKPAHQPRDVLNTCQSLFYLAARESLAGDERFSALMKQTADVKFWLNHAQLQKDGVNVNGFQLASFDNLLKESTTTGLLNFENGKIQVNLLNYAGKELTKLYKDFSGGKVNEPMLQRLPGKEIAAAFAINFKQDGLRELLKLLNLDGLMNVTFTTLEFNAEDFVKASNGDVVVSISDLAFKNDSAIISEKDATPFSFSEQMPAYDFIFTTNIGEKKSFNKLIRAGRGAGDRLLDEKMNQSLFFKNDSSFFALSNNQQNADKFIAATKNNADFVSKISGEPFGAYVNLQAVIKASQLRVVKDSALLSFYDVSLKMWDNVLLKGGNFNNGGLAFQIDINLQDKKTGSLLQLYNYSNMLNQFFKQQQKLHADKNVAIDFSTTEQRKSK